MTTHDGSTRYLAWVEDDALAEEDLDGGPWGRWLVLRPGLLLLDGEHSRSEVYHALKHLARPGSALLVAPLADDPKAKGMAPGWTTWLSDGH